MAGVRGSAIMATRPPMAAFYAIPKSVLLFNTVHSTTTVITPEAVAMFALTNI